jgi:hypothetical protein
MKESHQPLAPASRSESSLAPEWTPRGLAQRWRRTIRRPGDIALALGIGRFDGRIVGGLPPGAGETARPIYTFPPDTGRQRERFFRPAVKR